MCGGAGSGDWRGRVWREAILEGGQRGYARLCDSWGCYEGEDLGLSRSNLDERTTSLEIYMTARIFILTANSAEKRMLRRARRIAPLAATNPVQ
jgi:hypothetical protein